MKRITDFETLDDFGFKAVNANGKVEFVQCDRDFSKVNDFSDPNIVHTTGDLTSGRFFTLEDLASGGTLTVDLNDAIKDQAFLDLDYSLATSLAFLGSVYSTVAISLNNIVENYPNGFISTAGITGSGVYMTNMSDTTWYGATPRKIPDYTDYELVQGSGGTYQKTFTITGYLTGGTYALFFLDGDPDLGGAFTHIIQPKASTLDKFYGSLSQYQLDLLVPPYDRSNYWPRDSIATSNLYFEGSSYDSFLATERAWAQSADTHDTNWMWRKLYPDGQKTLDSDDSIMQKMILTIAMNFDQIKRYQDHLKYQHTIGYDRYNHISRDLVELLASQWNWALGHNLNQDDYSEFIYSQYENYVTGQSQQKLSAKDVNFEMWRRVLANIVTLYKKKGTREAIKYVANIYGLPEALLWIEELVEAIMFDGNGKTELLESESNIVVPMSGTQWYIDSAGSARTLPYRVVSNTKYLNINISPMDAIEFDYYDWGWESHPDIVNVNGDLTKVSSTTEVTKAEFFRTIVRNTIPSDGSARYAESYPLLEREADYYYTGSVNQYGLSDLEPYMNFLDDNWNVLISNLVPASSKLVSIGKLYRNPMWRREKKQWSSTELDARPLPFNEWVQIPNFVPSVEIKSASTINIEIPAPTGKQGVKPFAQLDSPTTLGSKTFGAAAVLPSPQESGKSYRRIYGQYSIQDPNGAYLTPASDTDELNISLSASTYTVGSPMVEPILGQSGSSTFIDYATDSLIVLNENNFDVVFSAYNLSDGGYTKLEFELFKKQQEEAIMIDDSIEYSIMSVMYEVPEYGVYKVSTVDQLDLFDFIEVDSDYLPYLNSAVQVTHIDSGTSQIRTSPSIGLFSLPTGVSNNSVDWFDFINSGAMAILQTLSRLGITEQQMIDVIREIVDYVDGGNLSDVPDIAREIYNLEQPAHVADLFSFFWEQDAGISYGALLVLDFVKSNSTWSLFSNVWALCNKVVGEQTKATFNRVVNFFNWKSPDQSVSYSNLSSGIFSETITTATTWEFYSPSFAGVLQLAYGQDVSFSADQSIHLSASTSGNSTNLIPTLVNDSWLPFHIYLSALGNFQVTAYTDNILYVTGSSLTDVPFSGNQNIAWFPDTISATTTPVFGDESFIHNSDSSLACYCVVTGTSNNNGSYRVYTYTDNGGFGGGLTAPFIILFPNQLTTYESASVGISIYENTDSTEGDFGFKSLNSGYRTEANDYSMTGTVNFGGLNYLNANILEDKQEYFYRTRAITHGPLSWGNLDGMLTFPISSSGGTLIDSGYDLTYWNDIKYYGRYFMHMKTPKAPATQIQNLSSSQETPDASVTIKFDGVGDSDRFEVQYYPLAEQPDDGSYSALTETQWETTATTINVNARDGVGDDYIYTVQTTLEPDTYYWLRVKNFRNKINMFGHNLEYFTASEPTWFLTGGFAGGGTREGEVPEEPTAPENIAIDDPQTGGRVKGFPSRGF